MPQARPMSVMYTPRTRKQERGIAKSEKRRQQFAAKQQERAEREAGCETLRAAWDAVRIYLGMEESEEARALVLHMDAAAASWPVVMRKRGPLSV